MSDGSRSFLREHDAESRVTTITLNRPERLNALTFEVYAELRDTFRSIASEADVNAIILTGSGRGFCSGGDVEDIIGALFERDRTGLLEFTRMTCDLILAIRQCPRPIVAALNGTVAGAGAVIATACDFRLGTPAAKIAYLFTRVGLSGADMGASWMLPRIVGLTHATNLLMTGTFISPEEAARIGLYTKVVEQDALMAEARDLAGRLARGPTDAIAITKAALNKEASMDLESALQFEAEVQADLMLHPNFRESYEAFLEKRDPRFV
jgi:enoyl-CoA hydratase/carnithine racemase